MEASARFGSALGARGQRAAPSDYVLDLQYLPPAKESSGCVVAWCAPEALNEAALQFHDPESLALLAMLPLSTLLQNEESLTVFHATSCKKGTQPLLFLGTSHGRLLALLFKAGRFHEREQELNKKELDESAIHALTYHKKSKLLFFGSSGTEPTVGEKEPQSRKRKRQAMVPVLGWFKKPSLSSAAPPLASPYFLYDIVADDYTVLTCSSQSLLAASMDGTVTQFDLALMKKQLEEKDETMDEDDVILGTMNVEHSIAHLTWHDEEHILVRGHDASLSEWNTERATCLYAFTPPSSSSTDKIVDVFVEAKEASLLVLMESTETKGDDTVHISYALRRVVSGNITDENVLSLAVHRSIRSALFSVRSEEQCQLYLGGEDGTIECFTIPFTSLRQKEETQVAPQLVGQVEEVTLEKSHVPTKKMKATTESGKKTKRIKV